MEKKYYTNPKVTKLLISHNILPGYLGFYYIGTILSSSLLTLDRRMNDIYIELSEMYGTTSAAVERDIRHIISKSDFSNNKSVKIALYTLDAEYEGEVANEIK